jgi:hypothetical protein
MLTPHGTIFPHRLAKTCLLGIFSLSGILFATCCVYSHYLAFYGSYARQVRHRKLQPSPLDLFPKVRSIQAPEVIPARNQHITIQRLDEMYPAFGKRKHGKCFALLFTRTTMHHVSYHLSSHLTSESVSMSRFLASSRMSSTISFSWDTSKASSSASFCTLCHASFNHRTHVRVAVCYICVTAKGAVSRIALHLRCKYITLAGHDTAQALGVTNV